MTMEERRGGRIPSGMGITPIGHSTLTPSQSALAEKAVRYYAETIMPHELERRNAISSRRKTPGQAMADFQSKAKTIIEQAERLYGLRTAGLKLEVNGAMAMVRKLEPSERLRVSVASATEPPPSVSILTRSDRPSVRELERRVQRFMDNLPEHRASLDYKYGMELLEEIREARLRAGSALDRDILEKLERGMNKALFGRKLPGDANELRKQQAERWRKI